MERDIDGRPNISSDFGGIGVSRSLRGRFLPQILTAAAMVCLFNPQSVLAQREDKIAEARLMLGQSDYTRNLVQVWDDNQLQISFDQLPQSSNLPILTNAVHPFGRNKIILSPDLEKEDVDTIADILAHELQHVANEHNGFFEQSDKKQACFDNEGSAYQTQAQFWLDRFGEAGKRSSSIYDFSNNFYADQWRRAPEVLRYRISALYRKLCDQFTTAWENGAIQLPIVKTQN